MLLCPVGQVLPAASEASQDQRAVVRVAAGPDLVEGCSRSLSLVAVGDDDESAVPLRVHARERALRLDRILLYETRRRLGDVIAEAEGLGQVDALREPEVVVDFVEQPHLASRETVYGLPVIADEEVSHACRASTLWPVPSCRPRCPGTRRSGRGCRDGSTARAR